MKRVLNLLGLAMRAGKLKTGEGFVIAAIRQKKAHLVLVASDASQNTQKQFSDKCQSYHIAISTQFSKVELSQAVGKATVSVAVCDSGFAKKMQTLLEQ